MFLKIFRIFKPKPTKPILNSSKIKWFIISIAKCEWNYITIITIKYLNAACFNGLTYKFITIAIIITKFLDLVITLLISLIVTLIIGNIITILRGKIII